MTGEYVKTVGDALMCECRSRDAVRLAVWITRNALSGRHAPSVHLGGNHGSTTERSGDYFGTTTNIAARVPGLAAGADVLVTRQTAALAPDLEGARYESGERQGLRNVAEPVEISPSFVWTRLRLSWRSTRTADGGRSRSRCRSPAARRGGA